MYLDFFTISSLVDEFMDTLVGGRVQDAIDVDETGLGLEIYAHRQRHYLYLSADNQRPRVYLAGDKLRRGLTRPKQIGLLFRRYVEGGRVTHISQPPWERLLHVHVEGPEGDVEIVAEIMERRSNILLLQNGVILDCMRRVGPEDNRYRLSLPAHEYTPPPPQTGKRDPFSITQDDILGFFQQNDDPKRKANQVLTGHLLGFSPLLAREIVYRASEGFNVTEDDPHGGHPNLKARDAEPEKIYAVMQDVLQPLKNREWRPGVAETEDEGMQAFSVYPLTYLPGWKPVESTSEAIAAYYGAPVGEDAYNTAKKPVQAAIKEARKRLSAKLNSLQNSTTDDSEREYLRQSGELILAYQYTMEEGQTELRAQYDPDQPELVIKLDPELTPLENAQRYFSKYEKSKRAMEDVPRLIQQTKTELDYLDQLENDLNQASSWPDIDDVQQSLQAGGYWRGKQAKRIGGGGRSAPIRIITDDAYVIWVGRNSRQNEIVTFKKANSEDYWLHARDVPGAHVIVKFDGRNIPDEIIEQAASLAAYYSARRSDGKVPVDITRCKYVKKIKGAAQGMVNYRNEKTLTAVPHDVAYFEED